MLAKKFVLGLALLGAFGGIARAEEVAARVETSGGFKPKLVTVNAGDVVEFVNTSTMVHTVTADPALAAKPENVILPEGALPFHSGALKPGDTFRHTFPVPGRYRFVCLPHEKHGMIGEVIVK